MLWGSNPPLSHSWSLSYLLNSYLFHPCPCRDQPLGSVHPVEFGSIITGEPSLPSKCGTWDMEREVRVGPCLLLDVPFT